MSDASELPISGFVTSLHLHSPTPDDPLPLRSVEYLDVVVDKGIVGDGRHFGRISSSTGKPSRRQVSLIAREQIAEHAATLGLETIVPGAVRSNIETQGV